MRRLFRGSLGQDTPTDFYTEPQDLINLRVNRTRQEPNGKTKTGKPRNKTIKYKQTIFRDEWEVGLDEETAHELIALEASLRWFNLVYTEYDMFFTEHDTGESRRLNPVLYAVFTNDFKHHGRLYTGKGGHQSLRKTERATIEFNGLPTVELDYGGLHVRMLYHLRGEEYPISRYVVDATVLPIFEGVKPILELKVIGRALLGA